MDHPILSTLAQSLPVAVMVPLGGLTPVMERACRHLLSPEEQGRADRFLRAENRQEFSVAHALKRTLLAAFCQQGPQSLRFGVRDGHGKPCLLSAETGLDFNISHATGAVGCVVSPTAMVGIDLEELSRRIPLDLADRFFAADEAAWIKDQPDPPQAFLRVWTLKEAFVKAAGRGVALGLETFSLRPPRCVPEIPPEGTLVTAPAAAQVIRQSGDACLGAAVRLWQWYSRSGHVVAVAMVGGGQEVPLVMDLSVEDLLRIAATSMRDAP